MTSRKGIENPEHIQSIIEKMRGRRDGLQKWLHENHPECFEEQKHTDGGTAERVYWHYGYTVALGDAIRALTDQPLDEKDRETINRLHMQRTGEPRWPTLQ